MSELFVNEYTAKKLERFLTELEKRGVLPKNYQDDLKLTPVEVHENSIVTKGLVLPKGTVPKSITFKGRRHKTLPVINHMITPEVTIFYLKGNLDQVNLKRKCLLKVSPSPTQDYIDLFENDKKKPLFRYNY